MHTLLQSTKVGNQNVRVHDSIEFNYDHEKRSGRVCEIRDGKRGINFLVETHDGFRSFKTSKMEGLHVRSIWGLVRKIFYRA